MADQKRWFKVWISILDDPHFQELTLEEIGAWTLLGALTAHVGNRGILAVPGAGRRLLEVLRARNLEEVKKLLKRLPSVTLECHKTRHGERIVTWKNWQKYQWDSTQAERQRASRAKKRREEISSTPTPSSQARRSSGRLAPATTLPGSWNDVRYPDDPRPGPLGRVETDPEEPA